MALAEIKRDNGRLAIVEIISGPNWEHRETMGILPKRPADLVSIGPAMETTDGWWFGTGERIVNGRRRWIGWRADEAELARINREFIEAITESSVPVTDDTFAEFSDDAMVVTFD